MCFIFEAMIKRIAMTESQAYEILGLPQGTIDENLIKKRFKELVLKTHPDVGGDTDQMKLLNRAKEIIDDQLFNNQRRHIDFDYQNYKKRPKILEQYFKDVVTRIKYILEKNKDKYIDYFKKFNQDVTLKIKSKFSSSGFLIEVSFVGLNVIYTFEIQDSPSYDKNETIYIVNPTMYYDNRIYKFSSSIFDKININKLNNLEILYPVEKIKKILKSNDFVKKDFNKSDAELLIKNKLNGSKINDSTWKIPIKNENEYILVNRLQSNYNPIAYWIIAGLYKGHEEIANVKSKSAIYLERLDPFLPEEKHHPEILTFIEFIRDMKEAKKGFYVWNSN